MEIAIFLVVENKQVRRMWCVYVYVYIYSYSNVFKLKLIPCIIKNQDIGTKKEKDESNDDDSEEEHMFSKATPEGMDVDGEDSDPYECPR